MKGTTTLETVEIDLIPPTMIRNTRTVRMIAVIFTGTWKDSERASAMELPWVMFPMPKEARVVKRAKRKPRTIPNCLFEKPFFMVYIGPPDRSPLLLTSRNLMASIHSENLVVSPKRAEIHIQTSAPGPPENMAVATPMMLPVPMVAARAVISAEKGETSPSPCFLWASLPNTLLSA